jgi:hypothetical protein
LNSFCRYLQRESAHFAVPALFGEDLTTRALAVSQLCAKLVPWILEGQLVPGDPSQPEKALSTLEPPSGSEVEGVFRAARGQNDIIPVIFGHVSEVVEPILADTGLLCPCGEELKWMAKISP